MEYKILWYDNLYDLENEVNKFLKMGWEPQGSLVTIPAFYQAMIRRKPKTKTKKLSISKPTN